MLRTRWKNLALKLYREINLMHLGRRSQLTLTNFHSENKAHVITAKRKTTSLHLIGQSNKKLERFSGGIICVPTLQRKRMAMQWSSVELFNQDQITIPLFRILSLLSINPFYRHRIGFYYNGTMGFSFLLSCRRII